MKSRWFVMMLAAAMPLAAQTVDFKFLDKLADKAKESSVVDLGPEQLGLLTGMAGDAKKGLAEVAKTLKSVQVRSYEFEEAGQYNMDEVRAFRDKIKASGNWVPLVTVREKNEFTDIMILKGADGLSKGFLIVAAEPKEVSIVHIDGPLDLSALGKLGGAFGIPEVTGLAKKSSGGAASKGKEEDEDEI